LEEARTHRRLGGDELARGDERAHEIKLLCSVFTLGT